MADIFISYVQEDSDVAHVVADGLEKEGYTVWYYERDSLPGYSYLEQILEVIDQAAAVVVILSTATLGSSQVNSEISEAHVAGKPLVPLLRELPYATLTSRRRAWGMMFGTAVAAPIPETGVGTLLPRLIRGLQALGVAPKPKRQSAPAQGQAPQSADNIGLFAPVVELNDLDGKLVRLADFAGHATAVLFWHPSCAFCQRILVDLKAWEANSPAGAPKLLLVSTGDVQQNREFGLRSPVVLDDGFRIGRAFGASGTPSAVLVGPDGKVASPLAVGGPSVLALLRNDATGLLDQSSATAGDGAPRVPHAVPLGGTAPQVTLPDLDGNQVTLDFSRNDRTALLFWNPGCGFCQRLLSELKEWEASRGAGAPRLVMISIGQPESNREHGVASTILLDQSFSTGEKFGASGTPSAILIDADGTVASELAVGGPDVMAMLRS